MLAMFVARHLRKLVLPVSLIEKYLVARLLWSVPTSVPWACDKIRTVVVTGYWTAHAWTHQRCPSKCARWRSPTAGLVDEASPRIASPASAVLSNIMW